MKATQRLTSLITLGAILGFMLASTSCSSLISPSAQAKIDQASTKYESATGISTVQTGGLLVKWWADLQAARELNKLLKTDPIPLGPIQATQASPLMDYTSAKAVLEGIQTSYVEPRSRVPQDVDDPVSPPLLLPSSPLPSSPSPVRRHDAHDDLQIAATN